MRIQLVEPSECVRVARLFPAASKDATKPALQSIYLDPLSPTRIAAVATDGFMMAWAILDRPEPHGLENPILLPPAACKALVKGSKSKAKPFTTFDTETHEIRIFPTKEGDAVFRPTPANYPAWRKVLPGQSSEFHPLEGHKLVADVSWRVAEILSEPSDYAGPGSMHFTRCGLRVGTSDLLMFHREGVSIIAKEPTFAYAAPEPVQAETFRAALALTAEEVSV